MSSANLVTGTEGIIVLPSGMEVNVESFSLQRTDAEEDTTAVQETQQNSAQTTFRYHGEVQGELVGGGQCARAGAAGLFYECRYAAYCGPGESVWPIPGHLEFAALQNCGNQPRQFHHHQVHCEFCKPERDLRA